MNKGKVMEGEKRTTLTTRRDRKRGEKNYDRGGVNAQRKRPWIATGMRENHDLDDGGWEPGD